MRVYRSNRMERLVDALAELVRTAPQEPFAPECIAVQGKGMERWLSMQLALRLGVWANPDFPFPRRLVERALRAALEEDPKLAALFEPETMMWTIAERLPRFVERHEFRPIRRYLADDESGRKLVQLAQRIANTFDHYTVYRPKMIIEWSKREVSNGDWQPILWHAIVKHHGPHHLPARALRFQEALAARRSLKAFPARVSLFGISTLPPLYVHLLSLLDSVAEVHVFLLSPTPEFWADDSGHPLLGSLGRVGSDFLDILESTPYQLVEGLYEEPPATSMLSILQADIFACRDRRVRSNAEKDDECTPPREIADTDDSIRVHSCHGSMREMEVLRDQLLALFDRDPSLTPNDVVVMMPSVDTYAPYIEAVFGAGPIPFRIADRDVRATNAVLDAIEAVLDLAQGRIRAPEMLDLLGIELVRARFEISEEDIDLIRTWVSESGICWGIDAKHRQEEGQPAFEENTWMFGLNRLFLGYAMRGEDRVLYEQTLPYDNIEGLRAEVLGHLAEFCAKIFAIHREIRAQKTIAEWKNLLVHVLEWTIAKTPASAHEHRNVVAALEAIAKRAEQAGFTGKVDLATVRAQLVAEARERSPAHGFLSGGVTFCELKPMRSIPFRVVCLVGMNDGAFPRTRRSPAFDLIAQSPRRGDRSSRNDDRYLFLEAILSARERLIITYTGRSVRDNVAMPPSAVVSELLDVLQQSFVCRGDGPLPMELWSTTAAKPADDVKRFVIVEHPLQPFSPSYFRDGPLFSYSQQNLAAARALKGPRGEPRPFVSQPLPPEDRTTAEVDVDRFVDFFKNPSRAWCQRRLGLYLGEAFDALSAREPIRPDALAKWKIGDFIIRRVLEGWDPDELFPILRARGSLPLGTLGVQYFNEIAEIATAVVEDARKKAGGEMSTVPIDLDVGGLRLIGTLSGVCEGSQVMALYSQLNGYHELEAWIRHLILCTVSGCGTYTTHLVGRGKNNDVASVAFAPPSAALPILEVLTKLYCEGHNFPLPLFRSSSYVFAAAASDKAEKALRAFRGHRGGSYNVGDWDDPYVYELYREIGDADAAFARLLDDESSHGFSHLAFAVFGPLLEHRSDNS